MKPSLLILTVFAIALGATSCSSLSPVSAQYDHSDSEFGMSAYGKVKNVDDLKALRPETDFNLQEPNKLNPEKETHIILQVDGGGIMGITPVILLAKIEAALQERRDFQNGEKERLKDYLSVCLGTSTGAIITGGITAGASAESLADFYKNKAPDLFNPGGKGRLPLSPVFQYVLNRRTFQQTLFDQIREAGKYKPTVRLGELDSAPSLVIAAYDSVSKRTVFLRNHDNPDSVVNTKDLQLVDAISASALSALIYFGKLPAPQVEVPQLLADGTGYTKKGAIFMDGGQGSQNSTITLAALEALRIKKEKPDSQVVLISLGCGNDYSERSFKEALGFHNIGQISDFLFQARGEASLLQWMAAEKVARECAEDLKVFRFDWNYTNPKEAEPFSVTDKQRQFMIDKAEEIAERKDFSQLLEDLSNDRLRLVQHAPTDGG